MLCFLRRGLFRRINSIARVSLSNFCGSRWLSSSGTRWQDKRSPRKVWSEQETQILQDLLGAGHSHAEISGRLTGRSIFAVEAHVRRLRQKGFLSPARKSTLFTAEEDKLLKHLRAQGLTYLAMLPKFPERTMRSLQARLHKISTTEEKKGGLTPDEVAQLRLLREKERLPWSEVALRMTGRSAKRLSKYYCRVTPLKDRVNIEPRHHYSEQQLADVLRLRAKGLTFKAVGAAMSISASSASSMLQTAQTGTLRHRTGARHRSRRWFLPDEDRRLVELKRTTRLWADIASKFPERSIKALKDHFFALRDKGRVVKDADGKFRLLEES